MSHAAQMYPFRLFISYAHKDDLLRQELETHLSLLERHGLIEIWSDRAIEAGREWEQSIHDKLEAANIILLLISPDFLASEFIYDNELKRAMERHNADMVRVIPVFLRPCDWKEEVFGKLQGVPVDAKPITQWEDRDEAFTVVVQAVRKAVATLGKERGRHNTEDYNRQKNQSPASEPFDRTYIKKAILIPKYKLSTLVIVTIIGLAMFIASMNMRPTRPQSQYGSDKDLTEKQRVIETQRIIQENIERSFRTFP